MQHFSTLAINQACRSICLIATAACAAIVLFLTAAFAQTGSYNGLVLQAQNEVPFNIPPGRTFFDVNAVDPRNIPADGLSNYSVVYRVIVYASAGASATTCSVGITEGPAGSRTVYSPPVTIPPYQTVQVAFEDVATAHAGDLIQASSTIAAGAAGAVTVGYFSSFTVIAYPTL